MYESLDDSGCPTTLNALVLQDVSEQMDEVHFVADTLTPEAAVYRDGDRFVVFGLEDGVVSVTLGIGDKDQFSNSIRLDEMTSYLYGGMKRGCHCTDDASLHDCLQMAANDLKEFASDFLHGDFRPFLRVISLKRQAELELEEAEKDKGNHGYLK